VWTQMMADTLAHAIVQCIEPEATSRGAALIALERLGVVESPPARTGALIQPIAKNAPLYTAELERQRRLYGKLFEESE
jgi:gluconokinase